MASKKIQLYTDRDKTIEASPETSANCVILSDGNDLQKVLDNDLTNPTVVHEETSFKVGVGDIDVSSSVVDGEVGRMVIKGKTYQNILPEPSTHVLTNNKEMFKVNEGLDPNVEIVDAVSKSAILSGQTLVNLAPKKIIEYTASSDWDGFNVLVQNSKKPNEHWRTLQDLKPNTKYYISCYVETFEDVNGRDYHFNNSNQNCLFVDFMKVNGVGHYQWISTTRSELTDEIFIALRCQNAYARGAIKIRDIMIIEYQEGMENWEIPYFTGMQSVKLPVLSTIGKNLIHVSKGYVPTAVNGGITISRDEANQTITLNGTSTIDNNCFALAPVDNLKILKGETYTITAYLISGVASGNYSFRLNDKGWSNAISTIIGGRLSNTKTYAKDALYIDSSVRIDTGATFENAVFKVQFEKNTASTSCEPYKTNILHTPEEVVLRSVENAQDTINLNTGEYVQRIGEVILNGSESWQVLDNNTENTIGFTLRKVLPLRKTGDKYVKVNCDKLPSYKENLWNNDKIGCVAENNINQDLNDTQLQVRVLKSTLSTQDTNGFKSWLQTNPLTIQYILETPVVKTVDLSSSGNWEKVVLDGSEDEGWRPYSSPYQNSTSLFGIAKTTNIFTNPLLPANNNTIPSLFSNHYDTETGNNIWNNEKVSVNINAAGDFFVRVNKSNGQDVEQFKQYLQQNPITVYYQTQNHRDSTQVKQPIFFKDGHIQLSSGADNSLIPTLDYQAKTSNSYVMDLMKPNTKYTIKASTASGKYTLDGIEYHLVGNGTIVTESNTDKFLVITQGSATDLMFLEGDLKNKNIPYFKGIKSAFEDESKIEVLSTGKNLFDMNRRYDNITNAQATVVQNVDEITISSIESGTYVNVNFVLDKNFFKGKTVVGSCLYESDEKGIGTVQINYQDTTGKNYYQSIKTSRTFTFPDEFVGEVLLCVYANNTNTPQSNTVTVKNIQLELGTKSTTYDSHKSNVSKIPLLSPLRSLPNGVCDELIVDRMKKKATLIQRVGYVTLGQGDGWGSYDNVGDTMKVGRSVLPHVKSNGEGMSALIPYTFNSVSQPNEGVYIYRHASSSEARVRLKLKRTGRHDAVGMQNWLRNNNIVTLYELETPIVTEIDLENFPLVYKDGHIFLNSEIAPVVEIDYNVNQAQQIQSNNETLQRHELDILDLDNLIVSFVNAEYNLRLLKFDMELSMMALAE